MSILFGICQAEGHVIEERQLIELSEATRRYAPDRTFVRTSGRTGMGFQPYHTHQRSNLELQPIVDKRGNMLTLDGRIDNYTELCDLLEIHGNEIADSLIVLAAFERWGEDCFSRLVGDWAIALWSEMNRSLYLARDHAGMRTLYFERADGIILWATFLEMFFVNGRKRAFDEAYAANYLACQPIRDLTPYEGIKAVTPAHYFVFHEGTEVHRPHWHWIIKGDIHYATNTEYEEHFIALFRQSVARRTGPGAPILAHLSGGMDSTSIVCMSDHIRKENGAKPQDLVDTVSYYDDSDPHWNETPYFSCVENDRRKMGLHLPLSLLSEDLLPASIPYLFPGTDSATHKNEVRLKEQSSPIEYRAILSGIGGDEVLGGVPTPLPELVDYLASGELCCFVKQAVAWCLINRTPLIHMSGNTIKFLFRQYFPLEIERTALPPWSTQKLERLLCVSSRPVTEEQHLYTMAPSRISNGSAWWTILETLPHLHPGHVARYEYRYPYLDRDLVDFLFRVPREQLLQPGRRRSMMRRALRGIVPTEVLERRRKGFRGKGLLATLSNNEGRLADLLKCSKAAEVGLIDPINLTETVVHAIHENGQRWTHAVTRLVLYELWQASSFENDLTAAKSLNTWRFVA